MDCPRPDDRRSRGFRRGTGRRDRRAARSAAADRASDAAVPPRLHAPRPYRQHLRNQLDQHGMLGLAKTVLGMRGLIEDKDFAAKYRAWETLPNDSLGNTVGDYFQATDSPCQAKRTASRKPACITIFQMSSAAMTPIRGRGEKSPRSPRATSAAAILRHPVRGADVQHPASTCARPPAASASGYSASLAWRNACSRHWSAAAR